MLFKEVIHVSIDTHTNPNTAVLLIIRAAGTYSYGLAFKG